MMATQAGFTLTHSDFMIRESALDVNVMISFEYQ